MITRLDIVLEEEPVESKDVVRGIIEEDGTFLVSFSGHDGYFRIPDSARMTKLKERILKAQRDHDEITFSFDRDLNILQIFG